MRVTQPAVLAAAASLLLGTMVTASGPAAAATDAPSSVAAAPSAIAATAVVRVDQVGYAVGSAQRAYLMTTAPAFGATFHLLDSTGRRIATGVAGADTGSWNSLWRHVYPLDFRVSTPGRFRIAVDSPTATSVSFRVASAGTLWAPYLRHTVTFFQAQRDGQHVIRGALNRKPAHLNDRSAKVYRHPRYTEPGSDVIANRDLTRTGPAMDVEGGWFDAGDFIKFTHTTAYSATLLLLAQRELGAKAPSTLRREARFGLSWLRKAYDPRHQRMLVQVGIGSGNKASTFYGDHDEWRLPQVDDTLQGKTMRFLRHRPAFVTDARPHRLAPNIAGRYAAAFALAAQLDARANPAHARREYRRAAEVFGLAKTTRVTRSDVVTALPHEFYPETSWRDDLELGASQLALAASALGMHTTAARWLRTASGWGRSYLRHEAGQASLNLYDVSAIGHTEAVRAGRELKVRVPRRRLLTDVRNQLLRATAHAQADLFAAGANYADFDVASHTFGLAATARMYAAVTGNHRFDTLAGRQLDWVFGANPWGVSLMIGAGTTFPHCPQHVVANLSGRLDGRPPILTGAVVNGPNDESLFADGLDEFFDNAPLCPADGVDRFAQFTGRGSRFVDDVRSWQTVEPANDFTATAALSLALAERATLGST